MKMKKGYVKERERDGQSDTAKLSGVHLVSKVGFRSADTAMAGEG